MLTSPMWVHWEFTDVNQTTCYERFRMKPSTFLKLCNTLKQNGFLKSSRYIKITEQVTTFVLIVTHSHTHRDVLDRIQRSSEIVNRYCHLVSKVLCSLGKTIIQPFAMQMPHPYVMKDSRYCNTLP
jgi:ribosomal protein S8